jgi:hypothetical protein
MNAFAHNFTVGAALNNPEHPITLDALRNYAPSAFATEPHLSRSDRYAYIPTSEIITALMAEGFQPFKASQSRSRIEGKAEFTKHMIRFRHPDCKTNVKVGDAVPEVILINSHDGTSAYKLSAGVYRFVCSNGLMVADSTIASLSVMHKGNIIDEVLEKSFQIVAQSNKALQRVTEWTGLTLSAPEQHLFASTAHEIRFADAEGKVETPITPQQLLVPRRVEDAGYSSRLPKPDLWHTLNTVQENVIKGGLSARQRGIDPETGRGRHRLVTTREVKGIDQDKRLNTALWRMAEKFADLKTGKA